MANRIPTILATAVAAACSLSAHAEEIKKPATGCTAVQTTAPSQDNFAKVVLYADVTIAKDSVCEWGIWEELEPTAAGPQTPLPLLASSQERYRPIGDVTPTTTPPVTPPVDPGSVGKLVGFGVIYAVESPILEQAAAVEGRFAPARQAFKLETDGTSWMPQEVTVSTVSIRDAVPAFDQFGPMELSGSSRHIREAVSETSMEYGSILTQLGSVASNLPGAPSELDHFNGEITRYVSGTPQAEALNQRPSAQFYGVWGVTTPENDMAVLLRNNVTATYSGYMVDEGNVRTGFIVMNTNFGNGTFNATVNGGRDQAGVTVQQTTSGQLQLQGQVGFYMSGTIAGANWQATSFNADDLKRNPKTLRPVPITGAASGSFIGPQAAAVIGAVDITKSNTRTDPASNSPIYDGGRYVSSLVAVKQQPK